MTQKQKEKLRARFFAMVSTSPTSNGCRPWLGCLGTKGYGIFELCDGGESMSEMAHRVAYAIGSDDFSILRMYGKGSGDFQVVRHVGSNGKPCDFRHCVEFSHLALGTKKSNAEDKIVHGTRQVGERNSFAKLTEDQIQEIARRYQEQRAKSGGKRVPNGFALALAEEFGTCREYVWEIGVGETWKYLKE